MTDIQKFVKKSVITLVTVVLLGSLFTTVYATTLIDNFEQGDGSGGQQVVCQGSGICPLLGAPSANFADGVANLGGQRDLQASLTSGSADVILTVDSGNDDLLAITIGNGTQGTAEVVWDGADDDPTVVTTSILDQSFNPDEGIRVAVITTDQASNMTVEVYDTGGDMASLTQAIPNDILFRTDFFFRFSDFTNISSVDLDHVSAVRLFVDGTVSNGLDMSLEFVESITVREYGDVPNTYTAAVAGNHIPLGTRFGERVDTEAAHQPAANADADDTADTSDEDGISRSLSSPWTPGTAPTNGGSIDVDVHGCPGTCAFSGWIDWDGDGNFSTAGDEIFNDQTVSNGDDQTFTFDIPATVDFTNDPPFYARFRICNAGNTCDTVNAADVQDGEIEDYLWDFTPTAVSLQDFNAASGSNVTIIFLVIGAAFLLTAVVIVRRRRLN